MEVMRRVASRLAARGFILRSGAADGADTAFEQGAGAKEIYLPWKGFNGSRSALYDLPSKPYAAQLAGTIHPRWSALKPAVKDLHCRNCWQVLGADLATPSEFVICWTPDGAQTWQERGRQTGGTGTAIALAASRGIPVINLKRPDAIERLARLVLERAS
ncbi:hypothetical protein IWX58_004816 [Rubrivivax gelatinosus]|nr:hypothetical protein [Rubrivivax gelatinosus]